jgi:hypothetical protein
MSVCPYGYRLDSYILETGIIRTSKNEGVRPQNFPKKSQFAKLPNKKVTYIYLYFAVLCLRALRLVEYILNKMITKNSSILLSLQVRIFCYYCYKTIALNSFRE